FPASPLARKTQLLLNSQMLNDNFKMVAIPLDAFVIVGRIDGGCHQQGYPHPGEYTGPPKAGPPKPTPPD
ncbi:MAG TPA: hypothetical protein PK490_09835, partial [Prosthecobacter sp.]|nr:hypothetical protein [Prosthecobacter sp.]